jgi:6-phosphogluconolactonase
MPVSRRELAMGLAASAMLAVAPRAARAQAAGDAYTVFIGTYTIPKGKAAGIVGLSLNKATGEMAQISETPATNPSFLALSKDNTRLYASNEVREFEGKPSGYVTAYEVLADGRLRELNKQPSNGVSPAHCALDRSGKVLIASNFISGHFSALPIDEDGKLLPSTDHVVRAGHGPHFGRQLGPHGHGVAINPRTGDIVCVDLGADGVDIYALNPEGRFVSKKQRMIVTPGAGPRHATYSNDGAFLYVLNEIHNSVAIFRTPTRPGDFQPIATISTLPADYRANPSTSEIAFDPTGRFLVVANRGPNTFAVFEVDSRTGLPGAPRFFPVGGEGPRHFGFSPDGAMIVASNYEGDSVVSHRFDKATGVITLLSKRNMPTPACAVFI